MSSHPEFNVRQWLESLGCGEYAEAFERNHIAPETLGEMTDADLKDCGVASLGHRKVLLKAIAELGPSLPPAPAALLPQPPPVSVSATQA